MLTDSIKIFPTGPIDADVRPPGSKSITNRALICSVLAKGASVLHGALQSDDTEVMVASLQ
ncbi:MAG: 3-phosphoshikimate 1-carboxyvinyltransferase, partial [Planctomycetaceae bacterium]|nr:3-phosphoshikimate 1-carboxyvinyltransferase [Planctomycetaceae bacterium]